MPHLAGHSRDQTPLFQRYRSAWLKPLELWDLRVGERILWDYMQAPELSRVLVEALIQIQQGEAATRSDGPVPKEAGQFETVFLGGGHRIIEEIRADPLRWPWPLVFSEEGSFVGEAGGLHLLASHAVAGMVVDLGQTQLKVSDGIRRWRFPRCWESLPLRDDVPVAAYPAQRETLRRFLATSLGQCLAESAVPVEGFVVALPARLDDRGVPEGSSYAGMQGDESLVQDALQMAGVKSPRIWLMNDAELAALSARSHPQVSRERCTLVLTLGFGLGAALLMPCS